MDAVFWGFPPLVDLMSWRIEWSRRSKYGGGSPVEVVTTDRRNASSLSVVVSRRMPQWQWDSALLFSGRTSRVDV